jgi:hypothetical protein
MILPISISTLTSLHVLISLVALSSGFISVYGLLKLRFMTRLMSVFLWTTVLTSVTGFLFPFDHLDPALIIGTISLAVLAVTIIAWSGFGLVGSWRWIFALGAITALYLNAFVFVAQAFNKVPLLRALDPTGMGPAFAVAQLFLLATFIGVGIVAIHRFRPAVADGSVILDGKTAP